MKKNYKNKISVIVPIYKVENYLPRCIDSIINQTYKNLEIILVDDGSPDKCGKICDEYAKKDKRIIVVHKKNGGLSDARNFGIKKSTGDYLCFVDSDDFVSEYYVEKLLDGALSTNSDICACNFEYIDEDGNKWLRKEKQNKIYNPKEALYDLFSINQNTEVMVWNKIYKKELFIKNKIKFPKGKIHEDNYTTFKLYDNANQIALINNKLYYYLQRDNSIMSTFNKNRFDILDSLKEVKEYFKDRKDMELAVQYNEILIYFSLLNNMIKLNYNGKEKQEIKDLIIDNKKIYLNNPLIPKHQKRMIKLLNSSLWLYSKIYLLLKA